MRPVFTLLLGLGVLIATSNVLASPPAPNVSNNVHILPNATPSQCPSTLNTRESSDIIQTDSGHGEDDSVSPVVRSCVGCAIDSASKDCVCAQCYDYTD